jgi:HD-GYP domain-containing protein (c-di-GMP phosphodiesterase class II)
MTAATTEKVPIANPLANFVPVRANALHSTGEVAVDLFVQYETGNEPVLYCKAGSRPDRQKLTELIDSGVANLYVREADFNTFSNGVYESLERILKDESLPPTEKFGALQLAVAVVMDQTLRLVDCSKFCTLAQEVGDNIVDLFGERDILPRELFKIARHDFNMFSHLTNVASYCVLLAGHLGITDQEEQRKIAAAAVLHDVGKRFIPAKILTKVPPLSPQERELVESHPQRGYEELCERQDLDYGQLMMVYQHHEHMDGTGYPVRLTKDEIHPWARMLAVVDVFDTMTARRPDRRVASPTRVLEYQTQMAGTHFDREVVECWVSAMNKT